MNKLKAIFFGVLLLMMFSASAQTFPLLNNAYSTNCSDMTVISNYWQKNSDGEIVQYSLRLKGNGLSLAKASVKKYSIDGDKLSSELVDVSNQERSFQTLEVKSDGKAIRIFNFSSGGEVIFKNGKLASDESREAALQSLCEPNSEVAVYIKSQFQTPAVKSEASVAKKPASVAPIDYQQGSSGSAEALCAATMYFAIGESTGSLKAKYQKIGANYLTAGAKLVGENKFTEMYELNKKIVNSATDKDFKSMVNSCIKMAPNTVPVESTSSQKKSADPEINERNCKAVKAMGPSSFEALANQYRKSINDFSFIRTEWDPSSSTPQFQCKVIVSTPTGPIRCNTDAIAKSSNGTMFVFIENALSKSAYCR